jgi:hypothetical protein
MKTGRLLFVVYIAYMAFMFDVFAGMPLWWAVSWKLPRGAAKD